jgi:DNA-binding NarL/FixJ family response regulator
VRRVRYQKVLLADGHQGLLGGVRSLLETAFDMVFMVADEVSLFEVAEKTKPDLIIADLSLQSTREINIVRSLKNRFPNIKLIVLSVHDDRAAVCECADAGADGFVLKRNAVDDLIPAIHEVLGSSGTVC